jgi:hypothetical protein
MADKTGQTRRQQRISVDVEPTIHRKVRLAAAHLDITVERYVVEAIVERIRRDACESAELPEALTSANDPILADLWNNEFDAAYDRL